MRKWIARSAVALTVLASGAGAAFMVLADAGDRKLARHVEVAVTAVPFRSDAASVERGGYLFRSRGCGDCHGADGAGRVVIDDGKGMLVRSPDITPAANGVVANYTPADWVRTIRHGVKPDGRPVMIMPSEEYNRLVDADVAAIVAYVRQLPPSTGAKARGAPADAGEGALRRRHGEGREREDRPLAAARAAGARRHHGRARRLRRQRLHRLPRRAPRRRQDPGRTARLAARPPSSRPAPAARSSAIRARSSSWRC